MGVGDVKNRRADVHHPPLRCIGVESANVGVAILGDPRVHATLNRDARNAIPYEFIGVVSVQT